MKSASCYDIQAEAHARNYSFAQRGYYRYAKCRPVFKRLKPRFEHLKKTALSKSHLTGAANYALYKWRELRRYSKPSYGHINIDQNPVEGAIRLTENRCPQLLACRTPQGGLAIGGHLLDRRNMSVASSRSAGVSDLGAPAARRGD